jgi:hypothetical protein
MAGESAVASATIVGDRQTIVRPDHIDVEIYQPFSTYIRRRCAHAMRRVTDRARESIGADVLLVPGPTGISQDLLQVMTFATHGVWPIHAEIRIREGVGD